MKGSRKAQLKLYQSYCKAMFTIAYRYLGKTDEAEDVTQEAFIKAFSNLKTFDGSSTFGAWLKQIVINQSIDALRKRKFDLNIDDVQLINHKDEIDWEVAECVSLSQIQTEIEKLPVKYSLVLKLFLMEGYDHEEIAGILNISVNASRTQLCRGKIMLKNQLKKKGYEVPA